MAEHPRDSGSEESPDEQRVREYRELLEELRVLIPGAEVLFGFLLAIRFTETFKELTTLQRDVYYGTLIATAVSLVLLMAPSAYHRIRFREGDKERLLHKGNREAIAGTGAIGLAFTGALFVVTDLLFETPAAIVVGAVFLAFVSWRWWLIALVRKADDDDHAEREQAESEASATS